MAWSTGQQSNDCVLTAISNFTGIDYEKVAQARVKANAINPRNNATVSSKLPDILKELGYNAIQIKGCRPTGDCLFRFTSGPRSKMGHMTAHVAGQCWENDGSSWNPKERKLWNMICTYIHK